MVKQKDQSLQFTNPILETVERTVDETTGWYR